MKVLSIAILISLLASCAPAIESEGIDSTFFDLSDFIDDYCASTDSLLAVRKSITVDGLREEQDLKDYPIQRDIRAFEVLDLNKAALWDRYAVDSTTSEEGNVIVTYSALEDDLGVQSLSIASKDHQVNSIKVRKEHHTFLADVSTIIEWLPKQGYVIKKDESQLFSDPTVHEIRVDIR